MNEKSFNAEMAEEGREKSASALPRFFLRVFVLKTPIL